MPTANPPTPYYAQWFFPLLIPDTHYLAVTTATMDSTVAWYAYTSIHASWNAQFVYSCRCTKNDGACKDIASNARAFMQCSVTLESAQKYLVKALQLVHDTQGGAEAGLVRGNTLTTSHPTDEHVW